MTEWKTKTLGEICDDGNGIIRTGPFGSQLHQSDYSEEGIPVVMPKNIIAGKISTEDIARIGDVHVTRLSQHQLKVGDIVYGRRGDIGRHAFVRESERGWLCGTGCLRISLGDSELDSLFLHYFLDQEDTIGWISNQAVGATMPNLNTSILRSVPITYPCLETQRRIASILGAYDDLIENNQRRIRILEEMAQRLYREWFVHFRFPGHHNTPLIDSPLGPIPKGWEVNKLGELVDDIRDGVSPDQVDPASPYVGLEHIPRKSIALTDWGRADEVQSTKLRFQKDDILFGKIRPYFHKVSIAPFSGICSSDTIVIRVKAPQHFGPVLCCVSSSEFVNQATQTSNGTKMPRANWDVLVNYPIPLPPASLLARFTSHARQTVDLVNNLVAKNANLRKTRDLLLPRLISGEVVMTGGNYGSYGLLHAAESAAAYGGERE